MVVVSEPLWLAATNCYAIATERGGQCVLVDAPPDLEGITKMLAVHDLTPTALLVTHGHVDHTGGSGAVVRATGATAYVHPDDDWMTLDPATQLAMLFGATPPEAGDFEPPDRFEILDDGQHLNLAGLSFEVRHTPGHTPGHCCFYLESEGMLFSGDQLFAGSIGRTDLPGGDHNQLMQSMETKVLTLPPDTDVLPGHGPRTTLAAERRTNPFLAELLQ